MTTAVIVDAIRTPLGKRNGKLKDWHPVDLAAETLNALIKNTGIDPAIVDETRPFERERSLDMYDPVNAPPYSDEFKNRYRAAQIARNRRISDWCMEQLDWLATSTSAPKGLEDIAFIVQGTGADLRFLDGSIDPSDREVGVTLWGPPTVALF